MSATPSLCEFFPDRELVDFIADHYSVAMAAHVGRILAADPKGERNFVQSVRRSITREMTEAAQRA